MAVAEEGDHAQSDVTEQTPLLARNSKDVVVQPNPLPMASVAVLCFSRMYVVLMR